MNRTLKAVVGIVAVAWASCGCAVNREPVISKLEGTWRVTEGHTIFRSMWRLPKRSTLADESLVSSSGRPFTIVIAKDGAFVWAETDFGVPFLKTLRLRTRGDRAEVEGVAGEDLGAQYEVTEARYTPCSSRIVVVAHQGRRMLGRMTMAAFLNADSSAVFKYTMEGIRGLNFGQETILTLTRP